MAIDFRKELNARYELLTKSIEDIEKKNQTFPDGRINVRVHQHRSYYYLDGGKSKDRYLTRKDAALIEQLIQKDYLNKVLKDAKTEQKAILKMLELYPETVAEDVYDSLSEGRKKYATPINICDPLKVGNKIIHPDFTILRMSDRKILYYEHCGKMDDADYKENMVERANDYSEAGIVLGDRLFYTFESDMTPLDIRTLDRITETHFR